jgi:hypothetical protein
MVLNVDATLLHDLRLPRDCGNIQLTVKLTDLPTQPQITGDS